MDFHLSDPYCTCFITGRNHPGFHLAELHKWHLSLLFQKDPKEVQVAKKRREQSKEQQKVILSWLIYVMLTEGMVDWLWLYWDSCAPRSFPISSWKAKAVRKLMSQHAAAVCLSYEALIFFPTLWYRVTGNLSKIFTESNRVRQQELLV